MGKIIKVATRSSALALKQTELVVSSLQRENPEFRFEVVTFSTTGDRVTDKPLYSFRGTGVFVKEIQQALIDSKADLAVHSLKDMPIESHDDLSVVSFPQRESPFDLFISSDGTSVDTIRKGAVVGTSSVRRMVQLKNIREDFRFKDLRGNVNTRLDKLKRGQYDAIVLAEAGLRRLGVDYSPSFVLDPSRCLPAPGQGILALECRKTDLQTLAVAESINDKRAMTEASCERDFLKCIGGGCTAAIAALSRVNKEGIAIEALVGDPNTAEVVRLSCETRHGENKPVGEILARRIQKLCIEKGISVDG
ncbi:Porphobilinogen deaminase [Chitinispirillum alkaliphilum]|nr:Porphobilinogen deaminase [Chitinispirillum alkaliphilum]